MCGIGASLDPAGAARPDAAQRMVEALRHRGPDGDGVRRLGPVTLAHTRLAIIDVAGGDQPLVSEDGPTTLIANGEIYNHRALRAELEQRPPLRHRLRLRGRRARLRGARARLRPQAERHLRLRPLGREPPAGASSPPATSSASSRSTGGATGAGSRSPRRSARSSRRAWPRPELDRTALDHYLACRFVPAPRTLFAGMSKLPAASTLIAEEGGAPRIETWRDAPGEPHRDLTDEDLADLLAERFTDAVERQMMSDVPYGAFLSGGVDSAGRRRRHATRSAQPPSTFTIGFPGHGGLLDERGPAAESARLIGTDHHDTAMVETDFLAELATAMPRLEEPCGIPSAPALAQLSRFAAQDVQVVLAGQGADEPTAATAATSGPRPCSAGSRLFPARSWIRRPPARQCPPRAAAPGARTTGGLERQAPPAPRRDRRAPVRRAALASQSDDAQQHGAWKARPETRCWPTSPAATCSSRRSTSTRTCSCPTASERRNDKMSIKAMA